MFFYHLKPNVTLGDIVNICDLKNFKYDKNILVKSFLKPSISSENDLTFFNKKKYNNHTKSKFIITSDNFQSSFRSDKKLLISGNLETDLAKLSNLFYRSKNKNEVLQLPDILIGERSDISSITSINKGVEIGNNFSLGDYSSIDHSCIIGNNVKIGKNVTISNAIIGDNVCISDGTKIGQPGFGFAYDGKKIIKIFHIGRVIIQNEVNIGVNCTIDRGSFSDTIIGENTFIDNLVHIAHNVSIGNNCIIAAQCGFAGSVEIGNHVHIGGQTGIAGHLKINDHTKIAAKSGVIRDVTKSETVMGYPAISINKYLRNYKKFMMDS